MALRWTEEDLKEYQARHKRQALPCVPSQPSGVSVADMESEKPKRRKYGNRKVTVDSMRFDSQHEADYYFGVLIPRVKAGELKCVCRQVPIDLPGGIRYIADFITIKPDMTVEAVIDAKSEITRKDRVYINKKKQVLKCWGIEIKEV